MSGGYHDILPCLHTRIVVNLQGYQLMSSQEEKPQSLPHLNDNSSINSTNHNNNITVWHVSHLCLYASKVIWLLL